MKPHPARGLFHRHRARIVELQFLVQPFEHAIDKIALGTIPRSVGLDVFRAHF